MAAACTVQKFGPRLRTGPKDTFVDWHVACTRRKSGVTAMTPSSPNGLARSIAFSFVGSGENTRAARALKALVEALPRLTDERGAAQPTDALLGRLVEALEPSAERRASCLVRARVAAARALTDARSKGLTPLTTFDAGYPPLLRQIPDPPIVLWLKGAGGPLPLRLQAPAVAVVGSRAATPTGLSVARRLARELAAGGLTIVSGLARGIDAAAHEGALDAGGATVAVLGCGADVVYPARHAALASRVADAGVLVSELPPGAPPLPHHFPLRNRIISGLARAVVIVEASEKSGSLITARAALEQGRDVLAVPGNVLSGCYRGCHALIRDGARLVERVEDIFDEINWRVQAAPGATNSLQLSALEETMTVGEPYSVDELARRAKRGAPDVVAELALLELNGRISRLAGGMFMRLDTAAMNKEG
jgi:DNA processing protein